MSHFPNLKSNFSKESLEILIGPTLNPLGNLSNPSGCPILLTKDHTIHLGDTKTHPSLDTCHPLKEKIKLIRRKTWTTSIFLHMYMVIICMLHLLFVIIVMHLVMWTLCVLIEEVFMEWMLFGLGRMYLSSWLTTQDPKIFGFLESMHENLFAYRCAWESWTRNGI